MSLLQFDQNIDTSKTYKPSDFQEGFLIEELEGAKEKVTLVGSQMPFKPFSWAGAQRIQKEFYPGNSEPVFQVFGPEEQDVTITGRFYDKKLSDTSLYGAAYELSQQLQAIRIRGHLCKFAMGEWVRYGYLSMTKFDMSRLSDIRYEMTLTLSGFNKPKFCQFLEETATIPFDINKDLIAKAAALQAAYSTAPTDLPATLGDIITSFVSDIAEAINVVTDFIDNVISTIEDVVSAINRVIGLIRDIKNRILGFIRRLGRISLTNLATGTTTSSFMTNANFLTGAMRGANDINLTVSNLSAGLASVIATVPLGRHLVIEGDSLQSIAVKFYEDSTLWKKIYDHNSLTTTDLIAGTVLEIPRE